VYCDVLRIVALYPDWALTVEAANSSSSARKRDAGFLICRTPRAMIIGGLLGDLNVV
jgi:hypothetical protein